MRKLIMAAMMAAGAAVTVMPAMAGAAPAHAAHVTAGPRLRCTRKVSGSTPGLTSYTIKVTSDPCHQPIRAAAYCFDQDPVTGIHWWKWYYGGVLHGRGRSTADCSTFVDKWLNWGYQYKQRAGGKWIWHQLGSNPSARVTARAHVPLPQWVHVCSDTRNRPCLAAGTTVEMKAYARGRRSQEFHRKKVGTVTCKRSQGIFYPYLVHALDCAEHGDAYGTWRSRTGDCLGANGTNDTFNTQTRCGSHKSLFVFRANDRYTPVSLSDAANDTLDLTNPGVNLAVYAGQETDPPVKSQEWFYETP